MNLKKIKVGQLCRYLILNMFLSIDIFHWGIMFCTKILFCFFRNQERDKIRIGLRTEGMTKH